MLHHFHLKPFILVVIVSMLQYGCFKSIDMATLLLYVATDSTFTIASTIQFTILASYDMMS